MRFINRNDAISEHKLKIFCSTLPRLNQNGKLHLHIRYAALLKTFEIVGG